MHDIDSCSVFNTHDMLHVQTAAWRSSNFTLLSTGIFFRVRLARAQVAMTRCGVLTFSGISVHQIRRWNGPAPFARYRAEVMKSEEPGIPRQTFQELSVLNPDKDSTFGCMIR